MTTKGEKYLYDNHKLNLRASPGTMHQLRLVATFKRITISEYVRQAIHDALIRDGYLIPVTMQDYQKARR